MLRVCQAVKCYGEVCEAVVASDMQISMRINAIYSSLMIKSFNK